MCSISTNGTMDSQLTSLGHHDKNMIERRLFQFASEANVHRSGGLDSPALTWKRRPQELRDANARKISIGRHRVYFNGSHKQCAYSAFYIKSFKKKGVDDEDDPRHQERLISAAGEPSKREIKNPDEKQDPDKKQDPNGK